MSRRISRVVVLLCRSLWAVCSVTLVVGCSDSGGSSTAPAPDLVVAIVRVTPAADTLGALGITSQFTATASNASGGPLTGQSFSWTSSDTAVATVNTTGLATATGNGTTAVSASVNGISASATLVVAQQAASLTLEPANDTLVAFTDTLRLTATVVDEQTQPIVSPTITWASSDTLVVTVDSTGLVTAVSNGSTSVVATAGATADTAAVTVAQVAASVSVVPAAGTLVSVGDTVALAATVADALGHPIVSATATWATSDAAVATVSTTGVVTAVANGTSAVSAAFNSLADTAAITVAQVPASVSSSAGDGQSAVVSTGVIIPPAVLVVDANGNPIPSVAVAFAVASGGGSVTGAAATTGADGVATVGSWVVGAAGANSVTATVTGSGITGNPVTFTATGVSTLFDIVVRYVAGTTPTTTQMAAFDNAVAFWRTVIVGDLAAIALNQPAGTCGGVSAPAVNETIDDLLIYVSFEAIDGAFGTLGSAGPCQVRAANTLPIMGGMRFDTADLPRLETDGDLGTTIRHEMGHVLGFGGLWPNLGFLQLPSDPLVPPGVAGNDTFFDGPEAITAFNDVGGTGYAFNKVPVENDNGLYSTGSLDSHWREGVFSTELMTPAINSGVLNPVSKVTVQSFKDMGYVVNSAGFETYVLPGPAQALRQPGALLLLNDVWRGPIFLVDETGATVGTLRR